MLQNDILDAYEWFIFYVWFYFGKMWKILEKRPFFRADMAGLGSIGIKYNVGLTHDQLIREIRHGPVLRISFKT